MSIKKLLTLGFDTANIGVRAGYSLSNFVWKATGLGTIYDKYRYRYMKELGLTWDDIVHNTEEGFPEAYSRMTPREQTMHMRRCYRAGDLAVKKTVLPKNIQEAHNVDVRILIGHLKDVQNEHYEKGGAYKMFY